MYNRKKLGKYAKETRMVMVIEAISGYPSPIHTHNRSPLVHGLTGARLKQVGGACLRMHCDEQRDAVCLCVPTITFYVQQRARAPILYTRIFTRKRAGALHYKCV